ncbi:hypothetical protein E2C01_082951 [Portunus trituberculatus]|uniref:Uncharacterized protein n=1 Tax=Portunus trituberculatus TaxID=210409 RepID=A0A5B7IR76_PORTR|nr:hypothetical protein [Portunus trituberculatus]
MTEEQRGVRAVVGGGGRDGPPLVSPGQMVKQFARLRVPGPTRPPLVSAQLHPIPSPKPPPQVSTRPNGCRSHYYSPQSHPSPWRCEQVKGNKDNTTKLQGPLVLCFLFPK